MIDVEALIRRTGELGVLPPIVARVAELATQVDPDPDSVVEVVGSDETLPAKLIRYANAAGGADQRQITTVSAAVARLDIGSVLAVSTASSMRVRLDRAVPEYGLGEGELWRHSVASAVVAQILSDAADVFVPPESAAAALLHDVGKLLLAPHLDANVISFLERAIDEGGLTEDQAEVELLEVSHGEVGGLIAQHWMLPQSIVRGVTYHHDPQRGEAAICDVVHTANELAQVITASHSGRGGGAAAGWPATLDASAVRRLGLTFDTLASVVNAAADRFSDALAHYSVA
jgi:HD-like signal output (HDOD) protein